MNLTRVLSVALPEIPTRAVSASPPRIPPGTVHKEHVEDGEKVVLVVVPNKFALFRFPPRNWQLIQFFDGTRSYHEIAAAYSNLIGVQYSTEEIRDFAASVDSLDFWYRTPQEKNIQLMRMNADERRKLLKVKKNRFGDLSEIAFPAFNPDKFVTWLHDKTKWIYTWWFTLLTLAAFALTAGISITYWSDIGRDTLEFFNFTDKSWGDIAMFYLLAVVILGIHELAHGHAAKHYGARVPAMGFLLIYLTPAFYTDTTEGYVLANSFQRVIIAMAGVWSELMICAIATPIWWGTAPNTTIHEAAYVVMLMTGIAAILLNWNPLMKLDGYQMLTELVGVSELKEDSTAYTLAWIKRRIWRLPVEVPYVPRRRRMGFAVYAVLSGAYSYSVLYILARFAGNVFRNFSPEWSFIPELTVAAIIFRSRIRKLVAFMKFLYLDKKDRIRAWFTARHTAQLAVVLLIAGLIPIRRDNAFGRLTLEAGQRSIVRAVVPGTVIGVYANEGWRVKPGMPLIRLQNLPLEARMDQSRTANRVASSRVNEAALHYANLGAALQERKRSAAENRGWSEQGAYLELSSQEAGTVMTPRLADRFGSFVAAGTELMEVDDLDELRARVYVSEHDMYKVQVGAPAKIAVEGFTRRWESRVTAVSPASTAGEAAITGNTQYSGLNTPQFYVAELLIRNENGKLRPGMAGSARIYSERRSMFGMALQELRMFIGRKMW